MAFSEYRWGVGWNVALADLVLVETQLHALNRKSAGSAAHSVGIKSPILDKFPVREGALSGKPRGDGFVNTRWTMVLGVGAIAFVEDLFFSGGTVVSVPVTIYTRLHTRTNTYERFNAYMELPDEGEGTIEYLRQNVARVTYKFHNLTMPS